MKSGSKYRTFLVFFLLILSALAAVSKIIVGYDTDEGYAVALAYRIASGQKMLVDTWDVYQTSVLTSAILLKPYLLLAGGVEGAFIYLRVCGAILQAAIAVYSYSVLKRCLNPFHAFIFAAVVNAFLPKEVQTIEHSYIVALFTLLAVILLIDRETSDRIVRKRMTLVLSALSYAFVVFSYPTMIISAPLVGAALFFLHDNSKQERIRLVVSYFAICAAAAAGFGIYLISYIHPGDLPFYFNELLNTGDHSRPFAALFERGSILKFFAIAGGLLALAVLLWILTRRWLHDRLFVYFYLLLVCTLAVIIPNITGIRLSGPMGLLERYGSILAAGLFFYFMLPMERRGRYRLFIFYGIGIFAGAIMATNQTIKENIQYIYPAVMGTLFLAMVLSEGLEERKRLLTDTVLAVFVIGLLFCKGYLVRVTSTFPANITELRARVTEGPLKGVWVYPEEKERYDAITLAFQKKLPPECSFQVIGRDPLLYLLSSESMNCPSCSNTVVYNERWIEYYTDDRHQIPDYLVIDMKTDSAEDFLKTPYGIWIRPNFDFNRRSIDSNCVFIEKVN